MRLKVKKRDAFWYKQWQRWFAWYPARIDDETLVWLEWIERKDRCPMHDAIVWEYRYANDTP